MADETTKTAQKTEPSRPADNKSQPRGQRFNHDELKATALVIYAEMIRRGSPDGFQMSTIAKRSFQRAHAFLEMSALVEAGEMNCEPPVDTPPEPIEVPMMELVKDDGATQTWQPLVDERTGKQITEMQLTDRDAFCPNLPPTHPLNLRFKSRIAGVVLKVDGKGKTYPHYPSGIKN